MFTLFSILCISRKTLSGSLIEHLFPYSDPFGGYLNQFVISDIGDCLFKVHCPSRCQRYCILRAFSSNVSQLLCCARIHVHILVEYVLSNDMPHVSWIVNANE